MAPKTYLQPEEQWDKSVALAMAAPREAVYSKRLGRDPGLGLGQVVYPHGLFRAGDVVLVRFSNGQAERQPVWAVSSKGYSVRDYYMQYQRWQADRRFQGGPLRLVELPGHLVGRTPDDPDVRRFVVGTLRAGDAAVR